jgi:uncharacterized protein YrrD
MCWEPPPPVLLGWCCALPPWTHCAAAHGRVSPHSEAARSGAPLNLGIRAARSATDLSNTSSTGRQQQTKTKRKQRKNIIMLNTAKTLEGFALETSEAEELGKVKEFYFDDRHWTIRYLVAETGTWLAERQVLISPYAVIAVNGEEKNIVTDLTRAQIEASPSLDSDKPVSHQFEQAYYGHYGYPMYWGGPLSWGAYPYIERGREQWKKSIQREKASWDHHLRSTYSVSGHHIQALDGEIGHVADFIIDDETWAIRYLVVDTHNWWPGKKVLVSPQWIERVSWGERKVFVNLSRETIKESPEYTEESLLTRDYEIGLHGHYNRKGYWVDELAAV